VRPFAYHAGAMTTPTFEPLEFVIGESLRWTKFVDLYRPADGWTLTYYFRGPGPGFDIVAGTEGTSHLVDNFETSTVSGLIAGRYTWQAWVENVDEEKHFIAQGAVTIKPGLVGSLASETADIRSENEQALANVRLALGKAVAKNAASYTIANRMKSEHSLTELLALESRLVQLVNQERQAAALRNGSPFLQNILTRFR